MTNTLLLTSCKNDIFCSALTSCSGTVWLASALLMMSCLCTCTEDSILRQGDAILSSLWVLTTHCMKGIIGSGQLSNTCGFPISLNNKPHTEFYTWTNVLIGRLVQYITHKVIWESGCSLQKLHELRTYSTKFAYSISVGSFLLAETIKMLRKIRSETFSCRNTCHCQTAQGAREENKATWCLE